MVGAHYYNFTARRSFARIWWRQCHCTLYLYAFLINEPEIMTDHTKQSIPARTILAICTGLLVFYWITSYQGLFIAALLIGIAGTFSAWFSMIVDRYWIRLAEILGIVTSSILLGVIFFLVVFPISILKRVFTRSDSMQLKKQQGSLLITVNKEYPRTSFEKLW
jgi:hypothetical protein